MVRHELRERLASFVRGGNTPKTGVTGVTGVAGVSATCLKSLKLQKLRPRRIETDKVANDVIRDVAGAVASPPGPVEAELDERKDLASACRSPISMLGRGCGVAVGKPQTADGVERRA
jgi:hypothetical protein